MKFNPYADEYTTFKYVRRLRFNEESIEINVIDGVGGKQQFTNSKPFVLYYDTKSLKILNTLQVLKLKSEKIKLNYSLEDLITNSDIQKCLKAWMRKNSGEVSNKVVALGRLV